MGEEVNDGGPAFPVADFIHPNGQVEHGHTGMSLREYYAGEALNAALCRWLDQEALSWEQKLAMIASQAFDVADAMIAEKARREKKT